jgi:hypothetical protein
MTMKIGVVALTENLVIFFIGPTGVIQTMSGIKMFLPDYSSSHESNIHKRLIV